ncbi:MAG TPA: hypothetical protein VMV07_18200 [Streptosporangiaceae bacterium]|nr:hypothetical protein [Streptosporangiaceae bacterium]
MAAPLPDATPSTPPPSMAAPAVVLRAETALPAAVRPVSASCVTDSKIPAPPPSASASPPPAAVAWPAPVVAAVAWFLVSVLPLTASALVESDSRRRW